MENENTQEVQSIGKPSFLYWYYNQAVHGMLEIVKSFLLFICNYFSIREMLVTLFSPWRRDVSYRNWRGFHPILALQTFFENLMTRCIGAILRIIVVVLGLIVALIIFVLSIEIVLVWISGPFIVLALYWFVFNGYVSFLMGSTIIAFWILVVYLLYRYDNKPIALRMDAEELLKSSVLERIAGRLGFTRKRFPQEILQNNEKLQEFLKLQGLSKDEYLNILQIELARHQRINDGGKFWRWENLKQIRPIGMQWRYGYTGNLDRYCQDLSFGDCSEYSHLHLIGRDDEYEILKMILARPDQNCALLVGNAGSGKRALIHSLASNIRSQQEFELRNQRLLLLDLGKVISDAISQGEDVENVLRTLFYEASYAGNVILLIEHIEFFLGNNESLMHPDITAVLTEFLNIPTFQIVALSTPKEYHQMIENHEHIVKYFEVVEMREPTEEQSIRILMDVFEKYERLRILFTYKALKRVVIESGRHNWKFPLPERAIDLAMDTLMFWEKRSDESFITEKTVADYLSMKTGVKQGEIEDDERSKLLNLEKRLHKLVIGQEEAVKQVSEALRRARSGIGNSDKPIGSFLFLGPTGVGKTETAKALARTYFGDEKHLVRLDMSEFKSPNSIDLLLGSSRLNQQGRLTTLIKDNPYCLLLLDEIEKAFPEILDIFLQILDEGYVTDAFGEKINFRNTIIIATSNAAAPLIKNMVMEGNEPEVIKQAVIDWTIDNNIFRTEFLNRFDGVIFFRPLEESELISVVRLQLQKFSRRLLKEKNIEISFDDKTVGKIIEKGYDPIFGARSLNRFIESEIESLLAKKIISGEVVQGQAVEISL